MPAFVNSYRKLDRDTAKNKVDNISCFDIRNMRLLSDKPNQSGARVNTYGNEFILDLGYGERIIGSKQLRNYVIIFTCANESATPSGQNGKIWKVDLNVTGTPVPILLYSGDLNFSAYYPINDEIVTRYENEEIQKIYWTDNYNYLRSANVATYLTTDGLVKSSGNSYIDPDLFNIVTEVDFKTPLFTKLISGTIPVGTIQYAYKLYKRHGSETIFSPASALIHLTTSSEGVLSSKYKGADRLDETGEPLSSGKGVEMTITGVDTSYDKIEIVSILYTAFNETPEINIVAVMNVSSTIIFSDDGTYNLGTYTLSEFTRLNNPMVCKTIATQNNILFAANIQKSEFDIDYDARAYRWNKTTGTCRIYHSDGRYYYNSNTDPAIWRINTSSNNYTWQDIPQYWDCLNTTNDLTVDRDNKEYIYQKDLVNIGGEGPNVKYSFTTDARVIDNGTEDRTFNSNANITPYYYTDYSSPEYAGKNRSFMRDEIYRFGIVFYSLQGQPSPVHWIGDIRFPSHDQSSAYVYTSTNTTYSRALRINFTVSNLPSSDVISGYQIVRVKREAKDRTIVFQGLLTPSGNSGGIYYYRLPNKSSAYWYYNGSALEKTHSFIISPELSFYKDFVQSSGDYVQIIGSHSVTNLRDALTLYPPDGSVHGPFSFHSYKYLSYTKVNLPYARYADVDTALLLKTVDTPDAEYENFGIGSFNYRKLLTSSGLLGDLGTCALIKLTAVLDAGLINGTGAESTSGHMMVNYRRPVTQYGGKTYTDRLNNYYIKASEFIPRTASSIVTSSSYGDVFIAFYDHLTAYFNRYYHREYNGSIALVDMFPCETTINLNLRHDDCYHRIYTAVPECHYIREVGNSEFTPVSVTYSPGWGDLYLYNTVYSREADVQKYYPKPYDYSDIPINDVLITASNVKYSNEEIDSWTQFLVNETIEVDSSFGGINYLRSWRNKLYYWQDNAMGLTSVLDRSLIQDDSGQSLALGEGAILNRFDTLLENIGCSTKYSLTLTTFGIYWLDWNHKSFYSFNGEIETLSLVKGMNSYFNGLDASIGIADNIYSTAVLRKGFSITSNSKFKEIWLNIRSGTSTGETLVYDEVGKNFTMFIDHQQCAGFIKQDDILYSTCYYIGPGFVGRLYKENSENVARGYYYDTYYDSYVDVVVNPSANDECTFTGLEISSNVYDSNNNNVYNKTITEYQARNDYQDTGVKVVSSANTRRLFRKWRINSIRDSVSGKPRMRDSYLQVKLIFTNDAVVNYRNTIVLNDLVTIFEGLPESFVHKQQ